MAMTLRVVVPPHPLIGHWLSVLRDQQTPPAIYASATTELGRWLTYEALRDWLPHRRVALQTPLAPAEGEIVDPAIPLLAVPMLRSGLGLWQGAQGVIPAAQVAHWGEGVDGLPAAIDARSGVLVLAPEVATGSSLLALLERLSALGVEGDRLRVITALAASAGLKAIGERFDHLTLYTACIDPDLDASGRPVPGIGSIQERLFGTSQSSAAAIGA
jgi:uracil phosphoribosyltransferase